MIPFLLAALAAYARADEQDGQTVVVTAKKEAVVQLIDKTVVDVSKLARAANGSAQDVLQATPGLTVSADGQIAVKGNSQVTVLVDGKPTAITAGSADERAVALQTMSGADIAGIEIMTNPSAAHDANGGAIVNIVLKRQRKAGAHGQVQGSMSDGGLWNGGASGELTLRVLTLHGSLGLRHDGNLKQRASSVDWRNPADGAVGLTRQGSSVFVHRVVDSAALGLDYALGQYDSLGLSARHNDRHSRPLLDVLVEHRDATGDALYHRISVGPNTQSDDSAGLAYSHQADGAALKASLQHSATATLVDKSYRDVAVAPVRADTYSHGSMGTRRTIDQATIDWSRVVEHGLVRGQWGAGLDVQDRVDTLANYQAALDPLTMAESPDADTSNGYTVMTAVRAAYATYKITHGQWEVLLGGRYTRTTLRVRDAATGMPPAHWASLDPSLHVGHALGEHADLRLSYRRSLQMPDPRDRDPDTSYVDAQNRSRGNPGLKPQRLDAWELGATGERAGWRFDAGLFYRVSRDTVTDARSIDDDLVLTSKQNGGRARSGGLTGGLDWTRDTRWHLGLDAGVVRVLLETPDMGMPVRQHGLSGYLNLRAGYSTGGEEIALDTHGQPAAITPLGRVGATSSVNLSWKRALDKTLSLTLDANDLFDGSRRSFTTTTSTYRQSGFEHVVARRVYLGLVRKL